jgi:hypothetical protein
MSLDNNNNSKEKHEDTVFLLRIQFRRNTSWQGTLQCLSTREKCVFRSILELGTLMNEAVAKNSGKESTEKPKFISWKDKEDVS